ncbi:peptidase M23 family protein [Gottschalkia purinilytica]|uniref:Peptidase M23 family protein n=1 Tax=Gottschalkia purinilytica TaxID=1503 RepID=A0A0L0WDB4_GOTPU|nr:M23 family metallopeptidase [Gottschalkia purinilytica]KNF09446.1 peptidase M23 family protein [Gottschalkia purinilytica]
MNNSKTFFNNIKRRYGYNYKNKDQKFYIKQIKKLFICLIILVIIIAIKKINFKKGNEVIKIVDDTINYTIDIKKDSKKLLAYMKKHSYIKDKVITAFSILKMEENQQKEIYMMPTRGDIKSNFGDIKETEDIKKVNKGVDILVKSSDIISIDNGTVLDVSENNGIFEIKIQHNKMQTLYKGIEESLVKEGQKVTKGDIIGRIQYTEGKEKLLHFQLWKDNKAVNPLNYIKTSSNDLII